jgi:MSHA pilin protein MshD
VPAAARGLSLVEQIVFIVIVSVAVAGVLGALNLSARDSVDPLIRKQALAIAEALMEEVQLMPFTYCDPDDPQAATATSATVGPTGCTSAASIEGLGPEAGETRYSATTPFDNVSDYHGYDTGTEVPPGIKDITNSAVAGLEAYRAQISIANAALGGIAASESLRITVSVTGPGNTTVVLQGYRTRHAPNATP